MRTARAGGERCVGRRGFLASAGILAASAGGGCSATAFAPAGGIVDTHVHFYDPSRPQGVPWPPKTDSLLYRTVLPPELKSLARPLGVTGCVIVEASPLEEDNQWVLDLAADDPFILGVVGHLKPGTPGFRAALDRFAHNPRFRGIRTGLWGVGIAAGDSAFVDDLRAVAERGLTLDVGQGVPHMETAARLASAVPDLRIVVNHFGGPRIGDREQDPRWLAAVRGAAAHPNVVMKLSGLVEGTGRREGDAPSSLDPYRPFFEAVWDAFGPGRLIFGSNWPVSARFAPYARVLNLARAFLAERGPAALAAGLRLNAARVYGL
jgi:predicted TIM-barrel fold metal-dependent hydrolase